MGYEMGADAHRVHIIKIPPVHIILAYLLWSVSLSSFIWCLTNMYHSDALVNVGVRASIGPVGGPFRAPFLVWKFYPRFRWSDHVLMCLSYLLILS